MSDDPKVNALLAKIETFKPALLFGGLAHPDLVKNHQLGPSFITNKIVGKR